MNDNGSPLRGQFGALLASRHSSVGLAFLKMRAGVRVDYAV